jgi:integrase
LPLGCVHSVCMAVRLGLLMRAKITKTAVDALKPGDILADNEVRGFVARRLPSGIVTYGLRYRVRGKQRWLALGIHGEITPDAARKLAKKRVGEVADDRDPASERQAKREKAKADRTNTVDALLDNFVKLYVRKNELRSSAEIERTFDKYVRPRIGVKIIYELRRSHIVEMLDAIDTDHGPVMADRTLGRLRKAFNWQATRDDQFVPPLVRGMARTKDSDRARKRILGEEELRDLWTALDNARLPDPFPRLVWALLLTAQRRDEVAGMRWEEIDVQAKIWGIPVSRRSDRKGGEHVVPLTDTILHLLGKPRKKGHVFSTTSGGKSFSGFSKAKKALDTAIAQLRKRSKRKPMPHWVLHDLRRTARSLMARAGVLPDTGERVIGHAIPGVRGVYDRHSYLDEKKDALERLAALIEQIVSDARLQQQERARLPRKSSVAPSSDH